MDRLKATVIINTYNGNQKYLLDSVNAIKNQNNVDVQLIVSTVKNDNSIFTLKDHDVDLLINDKPGIEYQLNNATKKIKNDWWCYISGNDIMEKNKLYTEISLCKDNNKKICYSAYNVCDENMGFLYKKEFFEYSFNKNLEGNFIHDAALINTELFFKYAPFNSKYDNLGFWNLWLRIGKSNQEHFLYSNHTDFNYRLSNDSRHVLRKKNKEWQKKEFNERIDMLSEFGELKGKYAKNNK